MEWLNEFIINLIDSLGVFGPLLACFLIVLESMIPILPLFVFISVNFIAFGKFLGLLISYGCTVIGCLLSFCLCRYVFRDFFERKFRKNIKVNKLMTRFDNIKFRNLVLLIAIPFTPAFLINIAAGLSKISFKKYLYSILTGKIFLVFFWGFVGTSLIESLKDPKKLISTLLIIGAAYLVSIFVSKKLHID